MAEEVLPANWTDESTGLACAIVRGPLGALNGYVAVPPSHPWFRRAYNDRLCDHGEDCWDHRIDERIAVHGGLTYSGAGVRGIEATEGRWWFGFDTAHAGDLVPDLGITFGDEVERTFEYVKAEVERLAAQLSEPSPTAARLSVDGTEGDGRG